MFYRAFLIFKICSWKLKILLYFNKLSYLENEMKITEFAHKYYRQHVMLNTSTGKARFGIYKNHIEPNFGNCGFYDLSKIMIYDWRNSLVIRGYKPAMINKIQVIFGTLIDLASDLEVCDQRLRQQMGFKTLKTGKYRETFLSKDEFKRLKYSCALSSNPYLFDIVLLLTLTGARKREILDATWSNLRLENSTLVVPKSKNGQMRIIYLNDDAVSIFRSHQNKSVIACNEYIFPNPITGKPYQCIFYSWNLARRQARLKELRIHDLRHSFASALVNQGVPIYDVQHLLGHSSIKTTQRYAHLDNKKLKESAKQAGRYFSLS
jgi:integrase